LSITLSALILALLAGWTATGQDWGSLSAYARNAVQIISGYAAAMSYENPTLSWQVSFEYVAGLLAFAIGLVGALQMTVEGPAGRRWGIVALWSCSASLPTRRDLSVTPRATALSIS
jgi:hypothetical protein